MGLVGVFFAIFGISILVIVHELGHYLAARAYGMRVTRFSIGLGPALVRYKPKDSPTTFQICAIPFLAYVQIDGMIPSDDVDPKDPTLFANKSLLARMVTIFAGPFANYLIASLVLFFTALMYWPSTEPLDPMTVARVTPDSPASKAGVKPGDVIVMANGEVIHTVTDLRRVTRSRANQPTAYIIERQRRRVTLTITPMVQEGQTIIGVAPKAKITSLPPAEAAIMAVKTPALITYEQLRELGKRLSQGSTEGLTGPLGMGKVLAEHAEQGPVEYIKILVLLSIALGMFNLLPFPALDGGRLVFLFYEMISRRKPSEKFEAVVHTVGIVFLLGVLVLVTVRDAIG